MKAAIALDSWKLPIFTARLDAAQFGYTQSPGLTPDMLILYVEVEDARIGVLNDVVYLAQQEAFEAAAARGTKH